MLFVENYQTKIWTVHNYSSVEKYLSNSKATKNETTSMKSRHLFYILALILFNIELAKAEEVFVLDTESQLQTIEHKHM